jgi:hypothetical protein
VTDNKPVRAGEEKRGGYSGGKPLSEMGPPARVPSAHLRPAQPKAPTKEDRPA